MSMPREELAKWVTRGSQRIIGLESLSEKLAGFLVKGFVETIESGQPIEDSPDLYLVGASSTGSDQANQFLEFKIGVEGAALIVHPKNPLGRLYHRAD